MGAAPGGFGGQDGPATPAPSPRQAHVKLAPCGVLDSKSITKLIWIFERIMDPQMLPKGCQIDPQNL